jgi:hypothetical protein
VLATGRMNCGGPGIVDRIVSGEIPLDEGRITQAVIDSSHGSDSLLARAALIAFVVCWVIGIVDSYSLGRSNTPQLQSPPHHEIGA